jgi:hypothetical protein
MRIFHEREGQAGDVPARPGQARDHPGCDGIGHRPNDDRDRLGHLLGRQRAGHRCRHEDVHVQPDQLGDERGEALGLALRRSVLNGNVVALDVAQVAQPLPEGLDLGGLRSRVHDTETSTARWWLRVRRKRRHEDTDATILGE